jgi:hypothetical protein
LADDDAVRSSLKSLPTWIWLVEAVGIGLLAVAGLTNGYIQALGLALGTALSLALPLGLMQHVLEERLGLKIEQVVSESIAAASERRLSGPAVPLVPEDLDLWPFAARAEPSPDCRMRLRLVSTSSTLSSSQPLEVMIVVTDPIDRTFSTDQKLQSIVDAEVIERAWPDDFTTGDIRTGAHVVEFYVAPLSGGPARRFGLAASAKFDYPAVTQAGPV